MHTGPEMTDMPPVTRGSRVEFWPDYGGALLWASGVRVDPRELPLPPELAVTAAEWVALYDDSKLPWEPTRDDAWIADGQRIFEALRDELWAHGIELVAGEDHWRP